MSTALEPVDDTVKTPSKAPRKKVKRLASERDAGTVQEQQKRREDEAGKEEETTGGEGMGKKTKTRASKGKKLGTDCNQKVD